MSLTPESLGEAAARLEQIEPGYLARVRHRASALAVPSSNKERVRRAIGLAVETAHINANVEITSEHRLGRLVKTVVSAVTRFYFLHVTGQASEFAEASAWVGQALMDYTADLEAEVTQLRQQVMRLEERLEARLEAP